ncbi:MAG: gamma-glutamyltransferase [Bacteroidota bacterium]
MRLLFRLAALLLISAGGSTPASAERPAYPAVVSADTVEAPVTAERAMVVSGHPEASRIGVRVMREGGNAVDAAVATAFALAVVLPDAGNVGGGGFLLWRGADGATTSFDFRETAPEAATRDMFLDSRGRVVPGRSTRGHLAAGVPGTVAGLLLAHERLGSLPLERLMEPAIALARDGQRLTGRNAFLFNRYRRDFERFESTARVFVREDGEPWQITDRFRQPDLARVLERVRDEGHDGFYRGATADLIVAEMERGGGLITHEDLAGYRAIERPVLEGRYRGRRVLTMGPPSAGGIALLQTLRAMEPYALRDMGFHSPAHVHLTGEALRRAFADRARWLGDPDRVEVPALALIDSAYVAQRMADFDPDAATASRAIAGGEPWTEGTETTHLSVVDAEGNTVALTTTINDYYGSKVVVDGAGFLLNNEMDDFASTPDAPNLWGLVQGDANAIAPGKRMVSSMTPTIVEDKTGRLAMVTGSPGGARIISTVLASIVNVFDFGMDAQTAVTLPRFHHQWLPDELEYERGVPDSTLSALRARGWRLDRLSRFGAANVIVVRDGADGSRTLEGGADPRRDDNDARGF